MHLTLLLMTWCKSYVTKLVERVGVQNSVKFWWHSCLQLQLRKSISDGVHLTDFGSTNICSPFGMPSGAGWNMGIIWACCLHCLLQLPHGHGDNIVNGTVVEVAIPLQCWVGRNFPTLVRTVWNELLCWECTVSTPPSLLIIPPFPSLPPRICSSVFYGPWKGLLWVITVIEWWAA